MKKVTKKTTPFFEKFLTEQENLDRVKGGRPDQTMKYPSDNDEGWDM